MVAGVHFSDGVLDSLNDLLEKISQPLLVRELLVLQGGPGKQTVQKVHVC
jgi:hypothetical protein